MGWDPLLGSEIGVGKAGKASMWQKVKDCLDYLNGKAAGAGLVNGSFELDTDADGVPDSWTKSLYPGGSSAFETTNPLHGVQAFKFTHPGGPGNGGGYLESSYVEVSELQGYLLCVEMQVSVTGIKNIHQLRYYDKDKVFVSSSDVLNETATHTNAELYKNYAVPPSTARFVKIRLIGGYNDTDVAGDIVFDGVVLRPIDIEVQSTGSQAMTPGSTYTPAAGTYNMTLQDVSNIYNVHLQLYMSAAWAPATNKGAPPAGLILFDGTNMRLKNSSGSITWSVYWQKFN